MPLLQNYNKLFEENDNIRKVIVDGNVVWPAKYIDYTEPFYVENISNSAETLHIKKSGSNAPTVTIEYSTDRTNWLTLGTTSTNELILNVAVGSKIYLRSQTNVFGGSATNSITGCSKICGNIMSLLYGSNFTNQRITPTNDASTFRSVFNIIDASYVDALIDASTLILPDNTTDWCFAHMFRRNHKLLYAPKLPATTLSDHCYFSMFHTCDLLKVAPELHASTLVSQCYNQMFNTCPSLIKITCTATSGINTNSSTSSWVTGISSTGTFYKKAGVTWPKGNNGIPSGWTVVEE